MILKKVDRWIRDLNHQRIDWMRSLKLKLSQKLFPWLGSLNYFQRSEKARNILVFRLDDKIGDSVAATGFLSELKKFFPNDQLIVLAGRNSAFIYQNLDFIDQVHVVKKGLLYSLLVYNKLKSNKYKSIINTSHLLNPSVIFLSSFLQAERKITFLNQNDLLWSQHVIYNPAQDHISVRYEKTLNLLGITNTQLDYQLQIPQSADSKKAFESIKNLRQKYSRVIILNSFAGARLRNFNQQTTTEIVKSLLTHKKDAVVVSIGSSDDLPVAQKWIAEFHNERWICFSEQTSLSFNFELVKQADLVMTPDTSLVHVASAFKKALVAVYREDEQKEKNSLIWAPYRTKFEIVYAPYDAEKKDDINTVDTQLVVQKALRLLE